MNSFKDHYRKINKKTGERVKTRHIDGMLPITTGKHSHEVVPVSHRANNNTVQEFEQLKRIKNGTKIIGSLKAKKLMDQFNITKNQGKLGNTGITITPHHHKPGFYLLQK